MIDRQGERGTKTEKQTQGRKVGTKTNIQSYKPEREIYRQRNEGSLFHILYPDLTRDRERQSETKRDRARQSEAERDRERLREPYRDRERQSEAEKDQDRLKETQRDTERRRETERD